MSDTSSSLTAQQLKRRAMSASSARAPQGYRNGLDSASNSDEILYSGIPQRPPRSNRKQSDATASPTLNGSQYYQHFQQQQPTSGAIQDPYYSPSTYSQSPKPSPRSTPLVYGGGYSGQVPPSPMSFQLPPSALSAREDSLRSGSISQQGQYQQQQQQQQQYRSPRMAPGSPSHSSSRSPLQSGMVSGAMPPPLTLPGSFLEDQLDYAEYYASDVGILSTPIIPPPQQQQQHLLSPVNSGPLSPWHVQQQQQNLYSQHQQQQQQQQHQSSGLPSPHMTPNTSPLQIDFPSLSLNGKVFL